MLKRRFFNKAVCLAVTFMMLSQQAVLTYAVPHKNDDVLAEVVFSNNLVAKGASVFVGDGDTPARVFEYGQEAWKLDPASGTSNRYIYVDIDDRIAHNLTDGRNILVEVEYTTERLHFHFSLFCIGEGNGNPLQCSCLENPRDGGACHLWGRTESDTTEAT